MRKMYLPLLAALAVSVPAVAQQTKQSTQSYVVQINQDLFKSESDDPVDPDERHVRQPAIWKNHNPKMERLLRRLEQAHGFKADNLYSHALNGFSAVLTDSQVALLSKFSGIVIEKNQQGRPQLWQDSTNGGQTVPWGIYATGANLSSAQSGANTQSVNFNNTRLYIVDTGVAFHPDLNIEQRVSLSYDPNPDDCFSHGTEVAGAAAAKNNGFGMAGTAPGVPITSVKIYDGCIASTSYSAAVQAIDWVYAKELEYFDYNRSYGGGIMNLSVIFGGDNSAMKAALSKIVTPSQVFKQISTGPAVFKQISFGGVFAVAAAGNDSEFACSKSPANVGVYMDGVVTVGAINNDGQKIPISNFGPCVETWAPGNNVYTTTLNNSYSAVSGTSFAAPFVAGLAALIRQSQGYMSPAQVESLLKARSLKTGFFAPDGAAISVPQANSY